MHLNILYTVYVKADNISRQNINGIRLINYASVDLTFNGVKTFFLIIFNFLICFPYILNLQKNHINAMVLNINNKSLSMKERA